MLYDLNKKIIDFSMANKFMIAYYYVSPEHEQNIEAFKQASGDAEKTLIMQYVRGWIGKNRTSYLDLAKFDIDARGMVPSEWAEVILHQGMEYLPPYVKEIQVPHNPLINIVLPQNLVKRGLNYFHLSTQNLILLRLAIHYDRDNAIGFISRIVKEHLDRNWDNLYAPQVAGEDLRDWDRIASNGNS